MNPITFILLFVAVFLIIMFRYLLLASIFHLIFYIWLPKTYFLRKLNKQAYSKAQFRKELYWSTITGLIFAFVGASAISAWQLGYTKIYTDINAYPIIWFPVSIAVAMLLHETYYYWLHRWMHSPKIFQLIHKVHHDSLITSPWTAFSFHPIEGLLEAIALPAIIIIVPMNLYAVLIHLSIMTVSAAINHLDIEIYPRNTFGNLLGKHVIGATHHSHHHKYYRFNFGLYFTFWDKFGKTESPNFEKEYKQRAKI